MNKKIIFLDVDGTLIDYEAKLPASAKKAVELARKNGHRVYLCTGCSKAELAQRELPEVDGLIGGNGAYVEDDGQVIMHQKLSLTEVTKIVDWVNFRKRGMYLETNVGMFCNEAFLTQAGKAMEKYALGKGFEPKAAADFATKFLSGYLPAYGKDLYRSDVNKIDFILSAYQDFLDAKKDFPTLETNTWGGKGEEALFGDFGPAGITKKHAIDILLKRLNENKEDTIAFGDAKIDISMFELCGFSVAMGSGGKECKEAADYITDNVDNDGLWKAFKYLKLI